MAGVDLNTFVFDYDLTFAALLMNADGSIYHTYAGRDGSGAQSHLSVGSFVGALQAGLETHAAHDVRNPPRKRKTLTVEQIPPMAKRIKRGKKPKCFHCHTVNDMRYQDLVARRKWSRDDLWRWPDPIQLGLTLQKEQQTTLAAVTPQSAAADAGLQAGDRLTQIGDRAVVTFGDVQRVLSELSAKPGTLAVTYRRPAQDGVDRLAELKLARNWREATPAVFAWRASKWPLSPKPGFGGKRLGPGEMKTAGLREDGFAFRIGYLVTWGANARTGHNARSAGLRKGDVIVSVAGKDDFESVAHFHTWFRFTRKIGTKIPVVRIRRGKRTTITLPVIR